MKETKCRVERTDFQAFIFEGDSLVLAVQCELEGALVHVEEDAEHSLLLESHTVLPPIDIRIMPNLTNSKEGPTSFDVAERELNLILIEGGIAAFLGRSNLITLYQLIHLNLVFNALLHIIYRRNTHFEFMLRPRISNNLPIVDSFSKSYVAEEISENVVIFVNEKMPLVRTDFYLLINLSDSFFDQILNGLNIPAKVRDNHSGDLPHLTLIYNTHTFLAKFFSTCGRFDQL